MKAVILGQTGVKNQLKEESSSNSYRRIERKIKEVGHQKYQKFKYPVNARKDIVLIFINQM
jgi:hypothetical protein